MKDKNKMTMYRKVCKECGNEMYVNKIKDEICWRCREEIKKKLKRSE